MGEVDVRKTSKISIEGKSDIKEPTCRSILFSVLLFAAQIPLREDCEEKCRSESAGTGALG